MAKLQEVLKRYEGKLSAEELQQLEQIIYTAHRLGHVAALRTIAAQPSLLRQVAGSRIVQMSGAGAMLVWLLQQPEIQSALVQLAGGASIGSVLTVPFVAIIARRAWMYWRARQAAIEQPQP